MCLKIFHSPSENGATESRKRMSPMPRRFRRCVVCLSHSIPWLPHQDSRSNGGSVRHWPWVVAAVTPWQSPEWGQGSGLCGPVLLWRRVTNQKLLYKTMKYDIMGIAWDLYGQIVLVKITSFVHSAKARTTTPRAPHDRSPTQLGRVYDPRRS